jgi:hypothetical protein
LWAIVWSYMHSRSTRSPFDLPPGKCSCDG